MNYKALEEAENVVRQSNDIPEPKKQQLAEKLQQARGPLDWDQWIYRLVVGGLCAAILACLTFSFLLMWQHAASPALQNEVKLPEIFMAVGSAAVGALAGLLAPSPASRR